MNSIVKLISLAPYSKCENGHDLIYQECLEKVSNKLNYRYLGLFPCNINVFKRRVNWKLFFRSIPQQRILDFFRVFFIHKSKKRLFFVESIPAIDLLFLSLGALFFSKKSDSLALFIRYGIENLRWQGKLHIALLNMLNKKMSTRLILITDSEIIANSFNKRISYTMTVLPIPHTTSLEKHNPSREILTYWWPGPPRKSKGLKDIQRIACNLPKDNSVQILAAKSSSLEECVLIDNVLTREEYEQWMIRSDVILLPYDPYIYQSGTSGIFVEAIFANKMAITKAGNWIAYELQKFDLQELIVDWDSPSFFETLKNLIKNENVKTKLAKMRRAYRNFHNIDSFASILQNCVNPQTDHNLSKSKIV